MATSVTLTGGVKQYLEACQSLHKTNGHLSVESLVLKHGRSFTYKPLPSNLHYDPIKECFRNAFNLVKRRRELTYVEGFASGFFPCWHAWCVTYNGIVVDPTWRDFTHRELPHDYFGIPFKIRYVSRQILATKQYGILYNRQGPLTVDDPTEFLKSLPMESIPA